MPKVSGEKRAAVAEKWNHAKEPYSEKVTRVEGYYYETPGGKPGEKTLSTDFHNEGEVVSKFRWSMFFKSCFSGC